MSESLVVALVRDVFFDEDGESRLVRTLAEAAGRGADLAVLPELPLDPWYPATRTPRETDAEPPDGPRARRLARAAREAGIGLVGGAIVRDREGNRFNTALIVDREGRSIDSYRKLHLPDETGFWETAHYAPGQTVPRVVRGLGVPIGVQICSDVNRPQGSHALAASGAEAIVVPRATEAATYPRWRLVLAATALTSGAYLLSVNRPRPEAGVALGGPSIAIAPDGEILAETEDILTLVAVRRARVERARRQYPGYLPVRAALYAESWSRAAETMAAPRGVS